MIRVYLRGILRWFREHLTQTSFTAAASSAAHCAILLAMLPPPERPHSTSAIGFRHLCLKKTFGRIFETWGYSLWSFGRPRRSSLLPNAAEVDEQCVHRTLAAPGLSASALSWPASGGAC